MKRSLRALALLPLLALVLALALPGAAMAQMEVSALFLNVGKADTALLTLGDQHYMVDTGKSGGFDELQNALTVCGVERLDGIFLSHTDKDHVGGLKKLLKSGMEVGTLYAGAIHSESGMDDHPVYKAAEKYDAPLQWLVAGDTLDLQNGCTVRVLGPLTSDPINENNNSLVLDVVTPEGNFLFTGDMELQEEQELLDAGLIPRATALKVAHHGDNDATGAAFAAQVAAQWAVISTSTEDEPDTPDERVLKHLWAAGSSVAVTQDATLGIRVTLQAGAATAEKLDLN